ncbi:MAG: sulfatase-like hydrolase/transferase, partial [Myxococcota bacterium]
QGWTGTSVRMDPYVPDSRSDYYLTPSLERFALEGMRFSNAYAAASICSPNRASIQTGRSPATLHMTGVLASPFHPPDDPTRRFIEPPLSTGLPLSEVTLAEAVREYRPEYAVGHFGKWHLGAQSPQEHGYTHAHPGNSHGQEATDRALDFIREQTEAGTPYVVQISHWAVHKGFPPSQQAENAVRFLKKGSRHRNPHVAAMTLDLDTDFGRLLDLLKELGVEDDTYVFYLSDNGAYTDLTNNTPLSGGKFSTLEGGIRVPFLARGPGIPSSAVSPTPIISWDLLPTILELVGADVPVDVEGGSLVSVMKESPFARVERHREELVWYYPHYYHFLGGSAPQAAIRIGNHKLWVDYESGVSGLFDVATDIGETQDLSHSNDALASDMRRRLDLYLRRVGAQMLVPRTDL